MHITRWHGAPVVTSLLWKQLFAGLNPGSCIDLDHPPSQALDTPVVVASPCSKTFQTAFMAGSRSKYEIFLTAIMTDNLPKLH